MTHLPVIAAAALSLIASLPATAQPRMVNVCIENRSNFPVSTWFSYNDWRNTRHSSQPVQTGSGHRNCVTIQDVTDLQTMAVFLGRGEEFDRPRRSSCSGRFARPQGTILMIVSQGQGWQIQCASTGG